ncbi:VOC family protein [Thalassomonas actiniarum]|nr:VOC family protein [Thalassomonas actiniarum]
MVLPPLNIESMANIYSKIDHVAVAVLDLEKAIAFYQQMLGFEFQGRRETLGKNSGMISAVMGSGNFTIVLIQGLEPESQVSRYVEQYGPGVQHIALEVNDLESATKLIEEQGFTFATGIIKGQGLRQIFSNRDENSGMMFEIIERTGNEGFEDDSIQDLFNQLEEAELV